MEKGTKGTRSLLALAAGRRAKWVVLALWVVVVGATAPLGGRLESVQENDQSSFLPAKAESTRVLDLRERFSSRAETPAVVVYRRKGGLAPEDRARVAADLEAIKKAGIEGVRTPSPPIPSGDGKALLFAVPIATDGDNGTLVDAIGRVRDRVEGNGGGLEVGVTGPAAFSADLVEVFGSADTKLLLATAAIVAVLLLLTYRSPFLWLVPLIAVGLAEAVSRAAYYGLGEAGLTISGQTSGLATVLLFGAGTDYALLLVARYREELRRHEDRHEAMARALEGAGPAILASAGTVALGLLCLLVADLNNNRGLGPVGAAAVALALAAMLTALPALLAVLGRGVFWPYVPRYGSASGEEPRLFSGLGRLISPRPRKVWVFTALVLIVMAAGLFKLDTGLTSLDAFRASVGSVKGQKILSESYPSGSGAPTTVVVRPAREAEKVRDAAANSPDVARVGAIERSGDLARFDVTLSPEPYGQKAFAAVKTLRERVRNAAGNGALVGGPTAQELDVRRAVVRDTAVIVPLVLSVVLAILALLLRAVVAPLVLIATVVLSFAASLGASVLVFDRVFGFPGIDPSLPLLAFVFLVALGVDYNIFLVARAREEAGRIGTRAGMLKALALTGGVITSAGLVLAGTFSVLGVLPLVVLTEIGFIVAFGVLIDTAVVRSVLVPALILDAGPKIWWPGSASVDGLREGTEAKPEADGLVTGRRPSGNRGEESRPLLPRSRSNLEESARGWEHQGHWDTPGPAPTTDGRGGDR